MAPAPLRALPCLGPSLGLCVSCVPTRWLRVLILIRMASRMFGRHFALYLLLLFLPLFGTLWLFLHSAFCTGSIFAFTLHRFGAFVLYISFSYCLQDHPFLVH